MMKKKIFILLSMLVLSTSVLADNPCVLYKTPPHFESNLAQDFSHLVIDSFLYNLQIRAGMGELEARAFFACLQKVSANDDVEAISQMIAYPLEIRTFHNNGIRDQVSYIHTRAEFKKHYQRIFTQAVKDDIQQSSLESMLLTQYGASLAQRGLTFTALVEKSKNPHVVKRLPIAIIKVLP
jgi:hypothetical protein